MRQRRLIIAITALIAVPLAWTWWSSERRQIERQVDRLQGLISKPGPENAISGLATARAITEFFAPSFEVRAHQFGFLARDRQELARFIHRYRSTSDSIDMRISDSSLSITAEHGRATQNATFEFLSGGPLSSSTERYRVQVNWLLEGGRWLIDYIDLLEVVDTAGIHRLPTLTHRSSANRSAAVA